MTKRIISPLNAFYIPELRPERTADELLKHWRGKMHGINKGTIHRSLKLGTDDEMEHTPFRYIARIIASHHLWKDINYYRKENHK